MDKINTVFKIGNQEFNNKDPLFIAEIGQVHDGSEGIAHSMIDALAECECKAIKFQIHLADYESSNQDLFRMNFSYEDKSRYQYWKRIEFSKLQWQRIINHCKNKNILVGASVFSLEALQIALEIGVDFLKVGSGDLLYEDLINAISLIKIPVIVSSGMATWSELELIRNKFKTHIEFNKFALLHCTSEYPTKATKIGINNIYEIEKRLNILSGLSDHSGNVLTLIYALAKGCKIFEFHIAFDKNMFGPDSSSSITLEDLKFLNKTNNYFKMLKNETCKDEACKNLENTKIKFARSIGFKKNMKKGETITSENICWRKPGGYLGKNDLDNVIGKKLVKDVNKLDLITIEDII